MNNSFREFRNYIEDIKVCEIPFEIQETASEVISKILVELEKRFENVETGHLVAHQIFRKEFYKSCSELKLNEFFSNIHEIYPSININILKPQFKIYYQRESLYEESVENLLKKFKEEGLDSIFSKIMSLGEIIVTTPMSTSDAERKFSCMKRLKTRLRSRMSNTRLNALGVLTMEKSLVNEKVLAEKESFQEKVLQHFIRQKNRKMNFFYKGKNTVL